MVLVVVNSGCIVRWGEVAVQDPAFVRVVRTVGTASFRVTS